MPEIDLALIKKILLKNRIPEPANIARYQSGIANRVYDIDDRYIVKLEGEFKGILAHQKEVTNKLFEAGARVPRILDADIVEDVHYLLMEKVRGTNIVYGWLKFSMKQKEGFIAQVTEQLQRFHSVTFPEYAIRIASGPRFSNLKNAVARITDFTKIAKGKLSSGLRSDVELLEEFYTSHLPLLEETGSAVLVHNDLHLENIFHEGDEITAIIDLDWVCQAPKDYELWKIVEVFRDPKYTVEERLESLYENYRMVEEFGFLKKYYPALFEARHLADRVRLYYLEHMLDRIANYQGEESNEKAVRIFQEEMQDLFKSDWLDKILG